MTGNIRYEIEAFNTATASENRIHDDSMARRFGFEGGLVPGVDVFAYMSRAALLAFGEQFLAGGRIHCRFGQPVYDGETVAIEAVTGDDGVLDISLTGRGTELATAGASLLTHPVTPAMADYPTADLPDADNRQPAGPASLPEGGALGTLREATDSESQAAYRTDVRETLEMYSARNLVHPGFLLRRANSALKDNVVLGPWIHVGSTATYLSPLASGEPLETRSRVARLYDHKGHGFVELDVALFSGERAIAQIEHVAIYEPRQVRMTA